MIKYGIPIYIILIILFLTLTGCSSTPPRWLAAMYDNNDPCQTRMREPGYKMPSFCGKGRTPGKVIIYDYYSGRPVKYNYAE